MSSNQVEIECLRAIRIACGDYAMELSRNGSRNFDRVHRAYWWLLEGEPRE